MPGAPPPDRSWRRPPGVAAGSVGDPHLGAVEDVAIATLYRPVSFIDTTSEPRPGSDIASRRHARPRSALADSAPFGRHCRSAADLVDAQVRVRAI
jgi:hypothetical protein